MDVLKHNVKRTVGLEGQNERVIKRFHAPAFPDRWRDRFRARREFGLLTSLFRSGLAVPEPLEVRRRSGRWELVTAYLPGTVRLSELIRGEAESPVRPAELARTVGRFLARLHAEGVDHGDLHPGNVLIDREGRPWLCDLANGRTHGRLPHRVARRDLVQLGAAARTRVGRRLRARFLSAYRRALPAALRARFEPLDVRSLEDAVRRRRQRDETRANRRWVRKSSSTVVVADAVLHRPAESDWPRVRSAIDGAARAPDGYFRIPYPGRSGEDLCGYADWKERHLEPVWRGDAQLWSSDVPCARPVAFVRSEPALAAYAIPEDSASLMEGFRQGSASERLRLAGELGRTIGCMHDAGLCMRDVGLRHFYATASRVVLGPVARPIAFDPARRHEAWEEPQRVGAWNGAERARFLDCYAVAFAHSRGEEEHLLAELTRG